MITKRQLLIATALVASAAGGARLAAEPVLGDDALYKQDWFLQSFLELGPDLAEAASGGKHFAVMWELKGCPYCRDTHLVNLADPEVAGYIQEQFAILQLNLIGDLEITDFDGMVLPEKDLAAHYGVRYTPTIRFFPPSAENLAELPPREREVLRLVGYSEPDPFRCSFT